MDSMYEGIVIEFKEDLERLEDLLSRVAGLDDLDEDQLDELCGHFLVTMITCEELLDVVYYDYFNELGAPSGDTSTTVLSEFVQLHKLSEEQAADLLDAMAVGVYFLTMPSWIETYPHIPAYVKDAFPLLPAYNVTLHALLEVVEELHKTP